MGEILSSPKPLGMQNGEDAPAFDKSNERALGDFLDERKGIDLNYADCLLLFIPGPDWSKMSSSPVEHQREMWIILPT